MAEPTPQVTFIKRSHRRHTPPTRITPCSTEVSMRARCQVPPPVAFVYSFPFLLPPCRKVHHSAPKDSNMDITTIMMPAMTGDVARAPHVLTSNDRHCRHHHSSRWHSSLPCTSPCYSHQGNAELPTCAAPALRCRPSTVRSCLAFQLSNGL